MIINLNLDAVLANSNIDEVKEAYKVLHRDKERFERWSNEAHDRISELQEELEERDCEHMAHMTQLEVS